MVRSRPSPACRRMSMRVLAEPSPGGLVQRGRAVRTVWLLLGLVLVGIGLIGIVVPLLPTTDFMLLALPCFADRKSVVWGKSVYVRVYLGGRRIIKKKKKNT